MEEGHHRPYRAPVTLHGETYVPRTVSRSGWSCARYAMQPRQPSADSSRSEFYTVTGVRGKSYQTTADSLPPDKPGNF